MSLLKGSSFEAELRLKKGLTSGNYTILFDAKNLSVDIIAEEGSPAAFNIPAELTVKYKGITINGNEININDPYFYHSGAFIVPGGSVSISNTNREIKIDGAQVNVGNYGFRPMDAKHYQKHIVLDGSRGTKLKIKYTYPDGTEMNATINAPKDAFSGIHNFDIDFNIETLSLDLSSSEISEFAIPIELTLEFNNPANSYQDRVNKFDPQFYRIVVENSTRRSIVIENQGVILNDTNNKIKVNKAQLRNCGLYGFDMSKLNYIYKYTSELTILNSKGGNINFKYIYPDGTVLQANLKIAKGSFQTESVTFWIDFNHDDFSVNLSPHGTNFVIPLELELKFDMSHNPQQFLNFLSNYGTNANFWYFDENGNQVELTSHGNIKIENNKVEINQVKLNHFSRYGWAT